MNELVSAVPPIIEGIQRFVEGFSNTISSVINSLYIPSYSEERKQELDAIYRKWGEYGWTSIPHANTDIFINEPANQQSANKIAMEYFRSGGIDSLFSALKQWRINKTDLDDAIFCYRHRKYKACSLLLFGLIDAKLIRTQSMQSRVNRKVGLKAVTKLRYLMTKKADIESTFFLYLESVNVLRCLESVFSDGENFSKKTDVINRNFVAHGMHTKRVRQRDCIQLFLLLYNLHVLLELA